MYMKLFIAVLSLGLCSFTTASPLENPLDDYTIVPMEWDLEVTPGGHTMKFNGSVEKVYAELLRINPHYEVERSAYLAAHGANNAADGDLVKRTDFSTSKYFCNGRWKGASAGEIEKGINYLRSLSGRPSLGPGPGKCSRVSCAWNSAIYWCNDERSTKTLNSFGSIADGAQWLSLYCTSHTGSFGFTAGQIFHPTNWNVIVTNDGPCE